MIFNLIATGFLIGLSIAAPVGPIGALCIQRSLRFGFIIGLVSGLGAATADALYGLIAASGLAAIRDFLMSSQTVLSFLGGILLCYLGIKTYFSTIASIGSHEENQISTISAFFSTLFLTFTNPMTILTFIALLSSVNFHQESSMAAFIFILGIFLGSCAWWLFVSIIASAFRTTLSVYHITLINKISAIIITGFGVKILFDVAKQLWV
jgi:threonine/homoserine/homoserine lactone efflux protein